MTAQNNALRLGSVYDQVGANLKTTYDFGAVFYAARSANLTLAVRVTRGGGAGITSVVVKLQSISPIDGTLQDDVQTFDIGTGDQVVEHTYTPPAQGTSAEFGPLEMNPAGLAGGCRIGVKVVGVPHAADEVVVYASM